MPKSELTSKQPSESPKDSRNQETFEFDPAYEDIGGIKHEFTGLLWTPAPGEDKKIEERDAPTPDLTNYNAKYVTVLTPRPWMTGRVKMSAKELIRLNATRGNDRTLSG